MVLFGVRVLNLMLEAKFLNLIPATARPSRISCLIFMMMRIMSMRRVLRMTGETRIMKMMRMKMRMYLRMIKDNDNKGGC